MPAWTAGTVAQKMKIPLVSTIHGSYLASSLLKKLYNNASIKADKVIAISNYVKDNILRAHPDKSSLIEVIHRGADINLFNPEKIAKSRIIQMSERFRLPDDKKIIMMPARSSGWKGHEILIRAFSNINNENLICVMPGSDDGGKFVLNLKNLAKELAQSFHSFLNLQSTQMVSFIKNLDMFEEFITFTFYGDIKKISSLQEYVKKNYLKSSTLIYKDDPKDNYLVVCKNQTCSNKIKSIDELKAVVKNYAI